MFIYIYIFIYIGICKYIHTYMYIICVYTYIFIYVYLYVYIYIYIFIYFYVNICIYIYISILVIQAFWPRWGLLCPESCVVVPATLEFWHWLLATALRRQENAKTRVDRRSTRDFALYRRFGRAGACCARNPA